MYSTPFSTVSFKVLHIFVLCYSSFSQPDGWWPM